MMGGLSSGRRTRTFTTRRIGMVRRISIGSRRIHKGLSKRGFRSSLYLLSELGRLGGKSRTTM
jgi:hypothetical protein